MPATTNNQLKTLFLAIVLAVGGGCSDNPVDPGDDEHAEAVAIELRLNGSVLYAYDSTDGSVTCDAPPCDLTLVAGGAPLLLEVVLLDADGDAVDPAALEDGFTLRSVVADETVASATVETADGAQAVRLMGLRAGTTQLRVTLRHGDEHDDLGTPPFGTAGAIDVRVEPEA